ncbi:MAG: hypothetical protein AAFY41_06230 [Bacteroidota bacterium]
MKKLIGILVLFLTIIACDPCEDCDSTIFEPTVSLVFINQDSIQILDDSLAVFAFNDSVLTANIDSLDILRDSLNVVNDSIANGGMLSNERADLQRWIEERRADSATFAAKNENADELTAEFNDIKGVISSGLIQVDQIAVLGTSFINTYDEVDSATEWSIPLSLNPLSSERSFNEYEVSIAGLTEIIELDYEVFEEVDQQRTVLVRARDIRVVDRMYVEIDSVKSNCEENCFDGTTVFTFYF